MDDPSPYVTELQRIRQKCGWDRERLARLSGVSLSTIKGIEFGYAKQQRTRPPVAQALALACARKLRRKPDDVLRELFPEVHAELFSDGDAA